MKYIYYTNWILLIIYPCFLLYSILIINSSGMDAAGKGMSQAFAMIGLFIAIVLIGLNLIQADWLRITILIIALLPIFSGIRDASQRYSYKKQREAGLKMYFNDPYLKEVVQAIENGDTEEVKKLLIDQKTELNQHSQRAGTVLSIAIDRATFGMPTPERLKIVKLLLENGADPNIYPPHKDHPLTQIAVDASFELFEVLLKAGADPNGKNTDGTTTLHHLVRDHHRDHFEKIQLILNEYNADPNASFGTEGWMLNYSTLIFAVSNRSWDIANLLIEKDEDLNCKPPSGYDFWYYLGIAQSDYTQSEEMPEGFKKLLENPKVIEGLKLRE